MGEVIRLFEDSPFETAWWQNHTPKFIHHSQTSLDAAIEIQPKAGTLRAKVLKCIQAHDGITDERIALELELNPSTARPRRVELAEQGLIESCGTAPTASGRKAVLWRATPTTESA